MVSINVGKHDEVAPEIIQYLVDHGQIYETLIGYDWTDLGRKSFAESSAEHEKQKAETRTGPAEKGDFFKEARTVFTNNDSDLEIPKKRRSAANGMPKQKPETKYKEIK